MIKLESEANKSEATTPVGSGTVLCRACGAPADEVRNINLYVIGSEGLNVCHDCEMQIVEFCRSMIRTATKARMAGYRACKQVADAKRHNVVREPSRTHDTQQPET
jgi:hypothetical protein